MAKGKKTVDVPLYKHGIIWWLIFGWYWRPFVFLFWLSYNMIFNVKVRFVKG